MILLLLAGALVIAPAHPPGLARLRRLYPPDAPEMSRRAWWLLPAVCGVAGGLLVLAVVGGSTGLVFAGPVSVAGACGAHRLLSGAAGEAADPLLMAGGWDLLAACLRCGLPVPPAVRAVAEYLPTEPGAQLRTIADRLALVADAATAWQVPESSPVHKLATAARRSANSGAGLASVAASAAAELRAGAQDVAAARGQRAGVLITGPLGLCFLPGFLALGVVPVVIGLASSLPVAW